MSQHDHVNDARVASSVMDAGSPGDAKEVITRYRRQVWNAAINAAARIVMDGEGLKLGRLRALKK